jgi:peptidyl-prolyl cis-trans isomerase B (cyclophilin B)
VSSIKDRQRAAARARLEKEMAERAEAARKRRNRQVVIGSALAVVVTAGLVFWLVTSLDKKDDKTDASASGTPAGTVACTWTPEDASKGGKIKDVGTPGPNAPNTGKDTLTLSTNLGDITATVDKAKAPCTAAAFEYLSSKKFWDNTKCHRMTTEGIKVLQCGDPSATGKGYRETDGSGGPSFRYAEENLPAAPAPDPSGAPPTTPTYPRGTLAMAKTQEPASTGSQFFIVYGDTTLDPSYTVLGTVDKGMDIVDKIAKGGVDNKNGPGDGHPKIEVDIKTLTMTPAA